MTNLLKKLDQNKEIVTYELHEITRFVNSSVVDIAISELTKEDLFVIKRGLEDLIIIHESHTAKETLKKLNFNINRYKDND